MFYHLTPKNLTGNVTWYPQRVRADDPDEPRDLIPCICVCPSVAQCIIALGDWKLYDEYTILQTEQNSAVPADWVFDFTLTQEHRFYEPVSFTVAGTLLTRDIIQVLGYAASLPLCAEEEAVILENASLQLFHLKKWIRPGLTVNA